MKHRLTRMPVFFGFWVCLFSAVCAGGEGLESKIAVQNLRVAEGLEVELFAGEPMIRQPVTMSFGEIAITGAGRVIRADVAPRTMVPGTQWTTYRARLTADTFAASPEAWQSILADLTGIAITVEAYASSNETMGLDNVILQRP